MFRLLRRFLNPIQWLSSAAILFVGLVPGLIASEMAYNASDLGWFRDQSDISVTGLWAFWAASTLSLSLLNLILKRPLTQPVIVSGILFILFFLFAALAVAAAAWGGKVYWIDFFIVLSLALFMVRCCLFLKDRSRKMTIVQAIGSGILTLYLIFPWQFWILESLSDSQRNFVATNVFGQKFVEAKQFTRHSAG